MSDDTISVPIQWVRGVLSLRVGRPRFEADHSPPSGAEVGSSGAVPPPSSSSSWRGA
jgi:hypothetical protein